MEDMTREQERMRERELRRRAPSPPACPHYTDGEVTLFILSVSTILSYLTSSLSLYLRRDNSIYSLSNLLSSLTLSLSLLY